MRNAMINDFRLGMRMLRYRAVPARVIVGETIFLIMGFILNLADKSLKSVGLPGEVFLTEAALMPAHLIYSLSLSGLVQSAPVHRRLQTSVPAVVNCCFVTAIYLVAALLNGILLAVRPEYIEAVCAGTVAMAGYAAFEMLLFALHYKYLWLTGVEAVGALVFVLGKGYVRSAIFQADARSLGLAFVLGLGIIVLGSLGQYGLSKLLWKR